MAWKHASVAHCFLALEEFEHESRISMIAESSVSTAGAYHLESSQHSLILTTALLCSRKSVRHSRAYLNFTDALQVYEFRAKFDGHNFVSERGVQFSCSVEYAPYQKVPKKTSKKDPKEGTLDKGNL